MNTSIEDIKIRNDLLYNLTENCMRGEFQSPFNEMPTPAIITKEILVQFSFYCFQLQIIDIQFIQFYLAKFSKSYQTSSELYVFCCGSRNSINTE